MTQDTHYPWLHTDLEGRHHIHVAAGVSFMAHRDGMLSYHKDDVDGGTMILRFRDQAEAVAYVLRSLDEAKA